MMSKAGIGWAPFYEAESPSWVAEEAVDPPYLERMIRSEWFTRFELLSGLSASGGAHVLEAGCGVGLYALCLARLGYRVTAFDYNERAVSMAERLRHQLDLPAERVSFAVDNLLDIHAPADQFDLVYNQSVMEYFCDEVELERGLGEMVRVLKPGGRLVLILQNTLHPVYRFKRLFGWQWFGGQPPVRLISARDLGRRLRALGLKDIREDGIEPWRGVLNGVPLVTRCRLGRAANRTLAGSLTRRVPFPRALRSRLGIQFVVSASKPPVCL